MQCEMCGKESVLFRTLVEGSTVNVCKGCSGFGKVLEEPKFEFNMRKKRASSVLCIKEDYSKLIKESREKRNLKQEEVAKDLGIKESIIHKIESGNTEPSIELARKFEKFFNINLVEDYEEKREFVSKGDRKGLTIGDLLKEKS